MRKHRKIAGATWRGSMSRASRVSKSAATPPLAGAAAAQKGSADGKAPPVIGEFGAVTALFAQPRSPVAALPEATGASVVLAAGLP